MVDATPQVELMTVTAAHGAPSLAEAAKLLGVAPADIDPAFGVVPVDPQRGLYAVQVAVGRGAPRSAEPGKPYAGPWANPRIVPFGPVQGD